MISIIVPIYNASDYLHACIDSLLNQTERDLQIILVDDGSKDDSLNIAKAYAQQDTRIEVYQQPHGGQSAARNYGLTHANGEFIAFVDADDALAFDWCEQHLKAINGVDYVQSGYQRGGKQFTPRHQFRLTSPCMRLYRRNTLEKLRFQEGMIYEDVLFSVDLWLSGASYRKINYAGYLYTINPNSTTSRPHREAQRCIFQSLRSRLKGQTCKGKLIVLLTILRLKAHYILS